MKISLGHLPPRKAEKQEIPGYVRKAVPAEMTVLFGSYASGNRIGFAEPDARSGDSSTNNS